MCIELHEKKYREIKLKIYIINHQTGSYNKLVLYDCVQGINNTSTLYSRWKIVFKSREISSA